MAETLMIPYLQANLTQGRVDGQRRGSFSGLKDVISQLLSHVRAVCLPTIQTAESLFHTNRLPPIDLVVRGVWSPIYDMIMRVVGVQMFTVGIASTMHNNFIACTELMRSIENLLGSERRSSLCYRLQQDRRWKDFSNKVPFPQVHQSSAHGCVVELAFVLSAANGRDHNPDRSIIELCADHRNFCKRNSRDL